MGAIQSIQRSGSATSSRKQGPKVLYDPRSRSNLGELRLLGDRGGANLRNRRNEEKRTASRKVSSQIIQMMSETRIGKALSLSLALIRLWDNLINLCSASERASERARRACLPHPRPRPHSPSLPPFASSSFHLLLIPSQMSSPSSSSSPPPPPARPPSTLSIASVPCMMHSPPTSYPSCIVRSMH